MNIMNMASGPVSRGNLRRVHLSGPTRRRITLLALALAANLNADPIPENLRQNGWFIGAQAYAFKEFSAFEAIAKTKEAGGNGIEFYPGQILKPGSTDKVHHAVSAVAMAE